MKNDKINVLHILSSLGLGGTERLIYYLAKYWKNPNIKIHICTLFSKDDPKDEPLLEEIEKLGYKVFRLSLKSWRDFDTFQKIKKHIHENNIQIVHSHSGTCEFWGPLLSRLSGIKKNILTKHHSAHPHLFWKRLRWTIVLHLFVNHVISVSNTVKNFLINDYYTDFSKIKTIYNPVDIEQFKPNDMHRKKIRNEFNIRDNEFVIGNTSRFDPMKGHIFFIKTAKFIINKIPNSKFLIIVDNKNMEKVEALLSENSLSKYFIIIKPNNKIHEYIQALDLFLFTSIYGEGFGIVLIEALSAGIPIVASNIGPIPEIIKDGYNGLLPTPKKWVLKAEYLDSKDLSDAVYEIYSKEKLKAEFIKNGLESVKKFSMDKYINELGKIYLNI